MRLRRHHLCPAALLLMLWALCLPACQQASPKPVPAQQPPAGTPAAAAEPTRDSAPRPSALLHLSDRWQAGQVISDEQLRHIRTDSCFSSEPIDSATFERISGHSYARGCATPLASLRYLRLLHRNTDGLTQTGEMICNQRIAADLLQIFRTLYDSAYVIERMVLIDDYDADDERSMTANNTTCFNFRPVSGTTRLSRHAAGMAVDVNPLYNPCVNLRTGHTEPAAGSPYARRPASRDAAGMQIVRGDLCYRLFTQHGFRWGGDWPASGRKKDYQHFAR